MKHILIHRSLRETKGFGFYIIWVRVGEKGRHPEIKTDRHFANKKLAFVVFFLPCVDEGCRRYLGVPG
jgi:hypothetical protein